MSRFIARLLFLPSLAWNILHCRILRVWNWWDQVDSLLFLGARPSRSDVVRLHELGVQAVINTCDEYAGPVAEYEACGITQLYLPTVDFTPPSLADVQTAVNFIEESHRQGQGVYVHCKAGRARSATIALCWLMQARGIDSTEALAFLKEKRKQVLTSLPEREVVKLFQASLAAAK